MGHESSLRLLLQSSARLLAASGMAEVLSVACRDAVGLALARAGFVTFAPPGQPWERAHHVAFDGQPRSVTAAGVSALFALQRVLALRREPVRLARDDETAAIFEGLSTTGDGEATAALVVPITNRRGRSIGQIVVTDPGGGDEVGDATASLVTELASLTASALEGAQRLAFARRDQDRMLLLAETAGEALWDWNLETGEFWWSRGIYGLVGSDAVPVQRKHGWRLDRIHPGDRERVERSFEDALASNAVSWRDEYRFRTAGDAWIFVEDRAYFLRAPTGLAYRIVGTTRDVSALRGALERETLARAQAEAASRTKDEFLAMLGHELRNPLAPILNALGLIRLRNPSSISRELTIIERQANHLVRLVDDLLDVARIVRGRIELKRERIEISELVARAVEMVRPLVDQRGHELDVRVPPRGLPIVVDPARIAQVISNLLTNAAKYTERRGRITVSAQAAGDVLEVCVADTGIGISSEMLPRVFDMFVQDHQAIDRAQGGLGLGLSIARSLVVMHGGEIGVHSDGPGRGSEFRFRIPRGLADEAGAAAEPGRSPRAWSGRRRILIVDDNVDASELLAETLRILGHTTCVAHDGLTALRVAREFEPDIALLDIGLPVLDGYDVARRMRRDPELAGVRLVAVTGYGRDGDKHTAMAAGFDAHVVKPASVDVIEQIVGDLASSRASRE